jgi:hypothetical protein
MRSFEEKKSTDELKMNTSGKEREIDSDAKESRYSLLLKQLTQTHS